MELSLGGLLMQLVWTLTIGGSHTDTKMLVPTTTLLPLTYVQYRGNRIFWTDVNQKLIWMSDLDEIEGHIIATGVDTPGTNYVCSTA